MLSILIPYKNTPHSCGYCTHQQGELSNYSTGAHAIRFMPTIYQSMIDRGWRRSGTYCYKPDLEISCCPQYTIRLNALEYTPSKHQRKLLRRWNNYILGEGTKKFPKKDASSNDFLTVLHQSEQTSDSHHRFTVTLEEASYTQEKYDLYNHYQNEIHNDPTSPGGFKRFLVDSPLCRESIKYTSANMERLPKTYGSYHQMYRLDGQLIAIGVLDILPGCVSSVYFMYDKQWEKFSLGKLSAMREVALTREMYEAGVKGIHWLYMGFYIHSCQKMRYKGEYIPSELLDPVSFEWYPINTCKELLEQHRYAVFSSPGKSKTERDSEESKWPEKELEKLKIIDGIEPDNVLRVTFAEDSRFWEDQYDRDRILSVASALGEQLCDEVLLMCE